MAAAESNILCPGWYSGVGERLAERVLCILGPCEVTMPVMLMVVKICPQVPTNVLDLTFDLTVRLWVVTRGQVDRDLEMLEKCLPYLRDELRAPV